MRPVLLLFLAACGCAQTLQRALPNNGECDEAHLAAARYIWLDVWQRSEPVPALSCVEEGKQWQPCKRASGTAGFINLFGDCVSGQTQPYLNHRGQAVIYVMRHGDAPPSSGALPHELVHAVWIYRLEPWPHHNQKGISGAPPEREAKFFGEVNATRLLMSEGGY